MGTIDRSSVIMIKFCIYFIFSNSDEVVAKLLTNTFLDWVVANTLPDASKLMSMIARSMVQGRPNTCVPMLLPVILKKLPNVNIHEGPVGDEDLSLSSSLVTPGSTQEQTLLWYLECLGSLLRW